MQHRAVRVVAALVCVHLPALDPVLLEHRERDVQGNRVFDPLGLRFDA